MIIQAIRRNGHKLPNARWEVPDQMMVVGQEYLVILPSIGSLEAEVEKSKSVDLGRSDDGNVFLMFRVARIRCVHDVANAIWENVVFIEPSQPRVEAMFQALNQESSGSSGISDD